MSALLGATTIFLLLAGCGAGSSTHSGSATTDNPARASRVLIGGYAFDPPEITVPAGTKISFTNRDQTAHTATATGASPAFDTGTLRPGATRAITITHPGRYAYYCQFHAFMRGTVTVTR